MAHTIMIHGREPLWPEVRQYLFDHLNRDSTRYLHDVIASGAEISAKSRSESCMLCWADLGP